MISDTDIIHPPSTPDINISTVEVYDDDTNVYFRLNVTGSIDPTHRYELCLDYDQNEKSVSWTSPTTKYIMSVFMVNASDGWAVGESGTILHWNGTDWSTVPSPTTKHLYDVFMVDANDGWAVGLDGAIIHWDGTEWSNVPSSTTQWIESVFMVNATDGWAVSHGAPLLKNILHWNGTEWSILTSPTAELYDVFMVDANDGWAVSTLGTIIHWNGTEWSTARSQTDEALASVSMVDASDGWAVGMVIAHWDGTEWSNVPNPTNEALWSVSMVNASDGWAVGESGTIIHWDGTEWTSVTSPTTRYLHEVFMVNATDGWAVGYFGRIIRWNGTEWISPYHTVALVDGEFLWDGSIQLTDSYFSGSSIVWAVPKSLETASNFTLQAFTHSGLTYSVDFAPADGREWSSSYVWQVGTDIEEAELTDVYSDYGLDLDGDGLFEYLVFTIEVNVTIEGTYTVDIGNLLDSSSTPIDIWNSTTLDLETGVQNVSVYMSGTELFSSGVNGPYTISSLYLFDSDFNLLDWRDNPYTTVNAYSYTDFEAPPTITNGILKVIIEDILNSNGIGVFTIKTDADHPNPEENVFYGGASENPWTSFTTIRVEDTLKEYVTSTQTKTPSSGYTVEHLDAYNPVVTRVSDTRATVSWATTENLLVTLLIDIRGTTIADTIVQVTVSIQNDDTTAHSVAMRHEWDLKIDGEDNSSIRVWTDPNNPQSWTETETDWVSPNFQFWETTNNPDTPVFSIYGSTVLPSTSPPPTVPDRFVYASWSACHHTAYDFTPSGQSGMDSAVLYYWNAEEISPGAQISRTAYVTTVVGEELVAFAQSTDSAGNPKSAFSTSDSAYVRGQSFPPDTDVTIYLIPDGEDALPANAVASVSATTDSSGGLPVTLAWSPPITSGEYDIWVDVNQNGDFDAGDVWNNQAGGIYGFSVSQSVNNPPYQPQLSITPSLAVEENDDLVVTVTGPTPADPDGDSVTYTYRWLVDTGTGQFVDDEVARRGDHTGNTVPAADTAVGDIWRVEVTPQDEHGAAGPPATATWQQVAPPDTTNPVANAGSDQTVVAGNTVSFNAGGSSDNVGIVSYEWDFGDGTTGTGITVTHTYTEPRTYTVTLTVRDAAGNSNTDSISVTVQKEIQKDTDGDGIPDITDTDDDNDGVNDNKDAFPLDPTETVDTDGDGIGNNADTDDDNDGVPDAQDAFPLDPLESLDTDGDGIGNNSDPDDDNDGVLDDEDAFPLNSLESTDTDADGIGNNEDTDDDGDGMPDTWETDNGLDPLDAQDAFLDSDNDGLTSFQEYEQGKNPNVYDAEAIQLRTLSVLAVVVGAFTAVTAAILANLAGLVTSFDSAISKLPIPDELKEFLQLYGEKLFETVDKAKLEALEKAPFITGGEAVALGISALIATIVFGAEEANGILNFLSLSGFANFIPSALVSVCVVILFAELFEAFCARTCRVHKQFRLWMYGIIMFLVSGLVFLFPLGSPGITRYRSGELSKKAKGLFVLSKMLLLLTLMIPFAGLFMLGFNTIGEIGLWFTLITVFSSLIPLRPLVGKALFDYRKEISLTALAASGILLFGFTYSLQAHVTFLPHVTYLAIGAVSAFLAAITLNQMRKARST